MSVTDPFVVPGDEIDEADGDGIPEVTGDTVVMSEDRWDALAGEQEQDDEDGLSEFAGREPVSLAEAAAGALGADGEEQQIAMIPACRVKFQGMSWDSLDDVPSLKQEMEFRVKGRVVGHGQQVMKDGEIRETATIEVTSVQQIG